MRKLASNIKKIREFRNLTQAFIARELKMSQSNYARLESGNITISKNQLEEISKILEINPSSIRYFDERVFMNLNPTQEFKIDSQLLSSFFGNLKLLYKEEISLLEKKIKLLEMISGQ